MVIATLFALTIEPQANTETGPAQGGQRPVSPELAKYSSDVQDMLLSTYLGHAGQEPDPEESAVILKQFLALNAHGNAGELASKRDALENEITTWQSRVRDNPTSRHAALGLAMLLTAKAGMTGDPGDRRAAADGYMRAGEMALNHGLIRYTHEISRALVAANDAAGLNEVFARTLNVGRKGDQKDYYLALVDYADGLGRLDRPQASQYFELAMQVSGAGNDTEAFNRYVIYLLDHGNPREALALLETMSSTERMGNWLPVFLRKRALDALHFNSRSADDEIAELEKRMNRTTGRAFRRPASMAAASPASGSSSLSIRPQAPWQHGYDRDDCRDWTYQAQLWCSSHGYGCFWPYTVNMTEIIFNEARSESAGAQVEVAWTMRDRALQGTSCRIYVGGVNYYPNPCDWYLPCNFQPPYTGECPQAKKYCCVEHGATTYVGAWQYQFNDSHQVFDDVDVSGALIRAYYTLNGLTVERSSSFIAPGVGGCFMDCNQPYCSSGINYWSPAPLGPMEYLNHVYVPDPNYVCGAVDSCAHGMDTPETISGIAATDMSSRLMRSTVFLVAVASTAVAAQPTPGVRRDFGHLAEALTSATADDGIKAGYRMFSLPDFADACKAAHAAEVVKLRSPQPQIRVRAGDPFDPNALRVLALDASGMIVPRVPTAVETDPDSPVLATSTPRVADGTVTPQRPGKFKLRIRTLCDAPVAETFITVQVTR